MNNGNIESIVHFLEENKIAIIFSEDGDIRSFSYNQFDEQLDTQPNSKTSSTVKEIITVNYSRDKGII